MDERLYKVALAKEQMTQTELAKKMGMAPATLIRKKAQNTFTIGEANKMIELLKISNPTEFFFDKPRT